VWMGLAWRLLLLLCRAEATTNAAEFLNSLPGIWAGFDSRVLRFKVRSQSCTWHPPPPFGGWRPCPSPPTTCCGVEQPAPLAPTTCPGSFPDGTWTPPILVARSPAPGAKVMAATLVNTVTRVHNVAPGAHCFSWCPQVLPLC